MGRAIRDESLPLELSLQRFHVDDKTIFYIAFHHALIGPVDLLNRDHFDVRCDVVLSTVIQHLLRFLDPADTGSCERPAVADEGEGGYGSGLLGYAYDHHLAVDPEQGEQSVDVVIR